MTAPKPRRKRRQFMVGGTMWRVLLVPPTDPRIIDEEDGKPLEGCCIFDDCLMLIREDFVIEAREEIFVHELEHIINRVSGARHEMTLHLRKEKSRDKHEERIVRARTPHLHRVFKDLGFRIPRGLLT